MILVQGPSCLFSAVIEKPFFSSSRQVTMYFDARHDQYITHVFVYQTFSALDNISIIQISYENTVSTGT
jgi:hypothetical protein